MFSKDDLDRYARHILLPGVGAVGQVKLKQARVLVVGAGGLGSPALLYLAAAGVGTLAVLDDDAVELSNLQRQILHGTPDAGRSKVDSALERLRALNPGVRYLPLKTRLTPENAEALIAGFDVVLDGSDSFATRYAVSDACVRLGIPLVYGAIERFEGQVSVLNGPGSASPGPCYRCLFPTPPEPGSAPSCAEAGVFGVLPGVVGSLMATEALKLLLNLGESLSGVLLHYDALAAQTYRVRVARRPGCPTCSL